MRIITMHLQGRQSTHKVGSEPELQEQEEHG